MMIKKIAALFLSVTLLFSFSVVSFATDDVSESHTLTEDTRKSFPYSSLTSDYLISLFESVTDLYIKEHLYEFSKEELYEKTLDKLIKEHPEYFSMILNSLLGSMDKYSGLHEKDIFNSLVSSESLGYGIVITDNDDKITIKEVVPDSNAEKAGLLEGDVIYSLMGYNVSALPWTAVSYMFSNPYLFIGEKDENGKYIDKNPEISLTVDRKGVLVPIVMKKGDVSDNGLSYTYYPDEKVGYIKIDSFLPPTLADDFIKLVKEINSQGVEKLIIDVRDNGGGSFEHVTRMAEIFVKKGEVMFYNSDRTLEEPEPIISSEADYVDFSSISVLINENSASASELLASVLKNKAGAVLVGKTSFGKAVGQNVYSLATGDTITITAFEILDANGESYNEKGLTPDLEIENVNMQYVLPELEVFNHINYKEITPGIYSEPTLALEQRLEVMGLLRESEVDGVWNDFTKTAILIMQVVSFKEGNGLLDDKSVTEITNIINGYKLETYYDDSQFDVALIYHSSLSQAKRLIKEKQKLAEKQEILIKETIDKYDNMMENMDN